MRIFAIVVGLTALFITPAMAASEADCLAQFKTADVNANGALEKSEDNKGYFSALARKGSKTATPDVIGRDEFLGSCKSDAFAQSNTESPAASRDLGKGDITPGAHPLSREEAMNKLNANGYKEINDLTLDAGGVWRATAFADGKRKPVAIDQQGDIVAQPGEEPSAAISASNAESVTSGNSRGLYVWLWLIIANAVGALFLSNVGGGTSAMSRSGVSIAERI